ncbi:MAG: hypothetical protein K2I61_02690 [Muribaculaceae bacterium]|nr:hypothetical protein [Muribaculaceae bacterium]
MTQTDYTTRVLHADQGHFLTQRAEVAIADRAVTDTVYLAATDTPDNWREITAGEAGEILAAQREAALAAAPEDVRQMIAAMEAASDTDPKAEDNGAEDHATA